MPRGIGKKAAPKRKSKRLRQINPAPVPAAAGKAITSKKTPAKTGKKKAPKNVAADPTTNVDDLDKKILEMQEQKEKMLLAQKKKAKPQKQFWEGR